MLRKYGLPVIAVILLGFALLHVVRAQQTPVKAPPPVVPARNPFSQTVAGAGIVEAQTENIAVGSPLPGVVTQVQVTVNQKVKAGEPLFRLDDRELQAELRVRKADLDAAQAELARLESLPRREELVLKEAKVREMKANVADQKDQYDRARAMFRGAGSAAIAEEELSKRQQAHRMAQEQLAWAEADLKLLQAGAWEPQKAVARAAVEQARSKYEQTEINLQRLTVKALVDGEVLQVNVRPGEFVGAPPSQALIVLGNVRQLHVRVDIDEHDIPRFTPGSPARAMLRGHQQEHFGLKFVRVEPYVVPKKSLTGDNKERVDTRVLQVIYALEPTSRTVYVGMQMDVFIDAENGKATAMK